MDQGNHSREPKGGLTPGCKIGSKMGCIDCQKNPQTVELHGGVEDKSLRICLVSPPKPNISAHLHPNHPFTDATFIPGFRQNYGIV